MDDASSRALFAGISGHQKESHVWQFSLHFTKTPLYIGVVGVCSKYPNTRSVVPYLGLTTQLLIIIGVYPSQTSFDSEIFCIGQAGMVLVALSASNMFMMKRFVRNVVEGLLLMIFIVLLVITSYNDLYYLSGQLGAFSMIAFTVRWMIIRFERFSMKKQVACIENTLKKAQEIEEEKLRVVEKTKQSVSNSLPVHVAQKFMYMVVLREFHGKVQILTLKNTLFYVK